MPQKIAVFSFRNDLQRCSFEQKFVEKFTYFVLKIRKKPLHQSWFKTKQIQEYLKDSKPYLVVLTAGISAKFCEENVWKLCEYVKDHYQGELDYCYSVFISNKEKAIPLWQQTSSKREDTLVIWDYHVIFIYNPPDRDAVVYDLDTSLSFQCDFQTYILQGIRSDQTLQPQFHRFFRVIPAAVFLQKFASDRSHMLNEDGEYLETPPGYPPIKTGESDNNINDFISMEPDVGVGTVLSLNDFAYKFLST